MDELDERVRSLLAESLRPIPLASRWRTPAMRRKALADAIGHLNYDPEKD